MKQNFIEILSTGSFFSESSIMAIDNWSIDLAVEQLRSRYTGRLDKPYGFRFMTKERGPNDLDSKVGELALRLGYSEKHISQLINGKVPITVDAAQRLERVLGSSMDFWLKLEANYQKHKARLEATERHAG